MPTTKTCTKCGETKPLDGFYKAKECRYGVRATCKPCMAEQRRRHYEKNRDDILEKQRRHREENRDELLERKRRYYEENRDDILEKQRRYREANRDDMAEYQRRYREENRDDILEKQRLYYGENRDIENAKRSKHRREAQEITEMFATAPKLTPWTPKEVTFLLADNGMTTYEKAVKLGRTYESCTGKLAHLRKKLGVSPGGH